MRTASVRAQIGHVAGTGTVPSRSLVLAALLVAVTGVDRGARAIAAKPSEVLLTPPPQLGPFSDEGHQWWASAGQPKSVVRIGYGASMSVGLARVSDASEHHGAFIDQSVLDRVQAVIDRDALATVLYGSHARGTADADSDIDVLQLVTSEAGSQSFGPVSLTRYTPSALRNMAMRGSLFVLYLRIDSYVLDDRRNVFLEALSLYRRPDSYSCLLDEVALAASALHIVNDTETYLPALYRLGTYLLRTALYARLAEANRPVFDTTAACRALGNTLVAKALESRRDTPPTLDKLRELRLAVEQILGEIPENRYQSVEGFAVAVGGGQELHSQLLVNVLFPELGEIDYAHLVTPML